MLSIAIRLRRLMITLLVISAILLSWSSQASADSFRFSLSIGTPAPVVVYPAPRVIYPAPVVVEYYEYYPAYHYHRYHRSGPPPWAPAHGYWKKHGRH